MVLDDFSLVSLEMLIAMKCIALWVAESSYVDSEDIALLPPEGGELLHTVEKWFFLPHFVQVLPKALHSFSLVCWEPSPWRFCPQCEQGFILCCNLYVLFLRGARVAGTPNRPDSSAVQNLTKLSRSVIVSSMA